jgi:hypothetical protein
MPFIPRQVKLPARLAITCKVPEATARLLKYYAEFLDSTQEYVIVETLRVAFRRDKEFQEWLATTHPDAPFTEHDSTTRSADHPRPTAASGAGRPASLSLGDPGRPGGSAARGER